MFGKSGGHSVTPLIERSRVGANIAGGLVAGADKLGQAMMARKRAKELKKGALATYQGLLGMEKADGKLDDDKYEELMAFGEGASTAELQGMLAAYARSQAMKADRSVTEDRKARLGLAQSADARAQEQHQAAMDAVPGEQARQEATTRMINAQADSYELQTQSKLAELEAKAAGLMMPSDQRKTITDSFKAIRAEPSVKTFEAASGLLESLRENANSPERSGPMDMGLIFSFMKVLDPGSTVREGEFANAQNSGSIPTSIYNAYNKALSGEMLSGEQVKQFMTAAEKSVSGYAKTANKVRKQHLDQLEKLKVDSSLIAIPEFKVESSGVPRFDDVSAAESANLPPGTEVMINGRRAVIE